MKIERFLTWIMKKLLNYPDIDFRTVKLFTNEFSKCLSNKEQNRWWLTLEMINEFTSKQLTIDESINKIKVNNLEADFKKIDEVLKPK